MPGVCRWVHAEDRAAPAITGSRSVSLVAMLVAVLVVLVIALDAAMILEIAVYALVAIGRNTATMDRTVIDRAIVFAMGATIDSALAAIFARAWAKG